MIDDSLARSLYDLHMTPSRSAALDEPPVLLKADLGWLCAQVLTAYHRAAAPAVEGMPAGFRGYLVLAAAASGCANNQLEVARRLGVDRSVMVGVLDELEDAGLVARKPNPTDRRERAIAVTPAGTKRLATVQRQLERATEHVLAPLSASRRESFLDLLNAIVAAIPATDARLAPQPCP
jgi:DNA-binding MarR family transcriptional regulator